jgi:hypothetical protein
MTLASFGMKKASLWSLLTRLLSTPCDGLWITDLHTLHAPLKQLLIPQPGRQSTKPPIFYPQSSFYTFSRLEELVPILPNAFNLLHPL